MAWALADPELGPILRYAAKWGMDSNWLQGQIQKTKWYQSHDQAARGWTDLAANDPAEAQKRVDAQTVALRNAANTMGVNLTSAQLTDLATQSLTNGWDQAEINNVLGGFIATNGAAFRVPNTSGTIPATMGPDGFLVDNVTGRRAYYGPNGEPAGPDQFAGAQSYKQADGTTVYYKPNSFNYNNPAQSSDPNQQRGQTAVTIEDLRKIAADNLVPVSNGTLMAWAQQIAQGANTPQAFQAYVQQTAVSLYPTLAKQIQSGLTVNQAVDPYRQKAASLLEISPDSIDFSKPQWAKAIQQVDPKTGDRTQMPLWQWERTLMQDPSYGYQFTNTARTQAATMAQTIGRMFGDTTGGTTAGI